MENIATLILEKHTLSDATQNFIHALQPDKTPDVSTWRGIVDIPERGAIDISVSEVESFMSMAIGFANVIMYGAYQFEQDIPEDEKTEIIEEQLSGIIEAYADCLIDFKITKVDLTL